MHQWHSAVSRPWCTCVIAVVVLLCTQHATPILPTPPCPCTATLPMSTMPDAIHHLPHANLHNALPPLTLLPLCRSGRRLSPAEVRRSSDAKQARAEAQRTALAEERAARLARASLGRATARSVMVGGRGGSSDQQHARVRTPSYIVSAGGWLGMVGGRQGWVMPMHAGHMLTGHCQHACGRVV